MKTFLAAVFSSMLPLTALAQGPSPPPQQTGQAEKTLVAVLQGKAANDALLSNSAQASRPRYRRLPSRRSELRRKPLGSCAVHGTGGIRDRSRLPRAAASF